MPKVYIIPTDVPNAFATGRNPEHAAVAVTAGIQRLLTDDELAGVLGHELTHVKNRDTLISTIAAIIGGAISTIAHFGMFFGGRSDDRDDMSITCVDWYGYFGAYSSCYYSDEYFSYS